MPQLLNKNQVSTPDNSKTTPGRSTGITKTLLTPCRRQGLSRKFKVTPTLKQSPSNTPNTATLSSPSTPVSGLKIQESPSVTLSPKRSEKPLQNRSTGECSRTNIQPRFETEDVEKLVNANSTPDDKKSKKLSDSNKRKQACKKLKREKVERKQNKTNLTEVVPCVNSEDDKSETNICKQPCVIIDPLQISEHKINEPKHANVNIIVSGAPKKKFNRCLSMKKNSCSEDELTDMDNLLSTPKTSTSSLLSSDFLKECNVNEDRVMGIVDETEVKVVRKKRCIVYSSDEDDFVPSQNSTKQEDDVSQKIQDEDWHVKVAEIKKQIKVKESRLADLKQAAVYKRLHNVKELEQSVKMWKRCCEEGLVHLLPKLQEHGQMDMSMLMKNLNIPNGIVYDTNTDSFM